MGPPTGSSDGKECRRPLPDRAMWDLRPTRPNADRPVRVPEACGAAGHLEVPDDPCQAQLVMNSRGRRASTALCSVLPLAALKAAGCEKIRSEKVSGTSTNGRQELKTLLEFIDAGDVLMVTRIDRLARSIGDLQDIVRALKAKGVALRATEQPIDTSTAAGKAFLDMLGVFAEFETNLRKERQMEGIAKAKAAGVYKGRPASIDPAQVRSSRLKAGDHLRSPASSALVAHPFIGL